MSFVTNRSTMSSTTNSETSSGWSSTSSLSLTPSFINDTATISFHMPQERCRRLRQPSLDSVFKIDTLPKRDWVPPAPMVRHLSRNDVSTRNIVVSAVVNNIVVEDTPPVSFVSGNQVSDVTQECKLLNLLDEASKYGSSDGVQDNYYASSARRRSRKKLSRHDTNMQFSTSTATYTQATATTTNSTSPVVANPYEGLFEDEKFDDAATQKRNRERRARYATEHPEAHQLLQKMAQFTRDSRRRQMAREGIRY